MVMRKKRPMRPVNTKCYYCEAKKSPDYKEVEELGRFVSDRGKLLSRSRTGICATHQRRLSTAVKRARHLALLPFVVKA